MSFVVTYDANVLYPASLRDTLVRLAMTKLFQAKWTDQILNEMVQAILRKQPDLKQKLDRTCSLMNDYIPDARVTGYEDLIESLELPDLDDRHVLATAIRSNSQVIVTNNLKDFPHDYLDKYDIEAQSADDFILHVMELDAETVITVLGEQASDYEKPTMTREMLMNVLIKHVPRSMSVIRQYLS